MHNKIYAEPQHKLLFRVVKNMMFHFLHKKRKGILVGKTAIQMSRKKKARKQNEKQNLIYLKRYGIMAG
jgi:hypothetical protein